MKLKKQHFVAVLLFVGLGVVGLLMFNFFETVPPQISVFPDPKGYLPIQKVFKISFFEKGRGLRAIDIYLVQDGKRYYLLKKSFPWTFQKGSQQMQETVKLTIAPAKLGLHDGTATFIISASDCSLWHWGKGNCAERKYSVIIDATPPTIEVLTRSHNVAVGGSALTIYRASEPLESQGVKEADKYFFKGYLVKGLYLCLFAYPYNAPPDMLLRVFGLDKAGNKGEGGFYYHIIRRRFKPDKIRITDSFLHAKMPDFWNVYPELQGKYLETFLKVNTDLRQRTNEEIKRICQISNPYPLFEGAFVRMKGATRATFGDRRSYYYHGQKIGTSVHMGVDLASVAHAPVPAANNGVVVFRGFLGVYGNAIIIDHGIGLFSLYGHLSSFKVKEGQQVTKGEIIGYTGATGLAGGDHLHFSMLVQGYYVNPVEWWDGHWVKTHILDKMKKTGVLP